MKNHWRAFFLTLSVGMFAFFSDVPAQIQAPKDEQGKYWIVPGLRNGASFFPRTSLKETKPLQAGVLDFKHYHKYTEQVEFLRKWEKQYPNLVDLYVVAQSFGGVDIYQMTVTDKKTGRAEDKPAMYVEGNRHAGEVTAAESALWMMNHLLTQYGKDPEVTRLLDKFTFYFRPCNNPDGSMLYLETAQTLRSTVRPFDEDGDGLTDEDPAEDLNGDGFVTQMRIKVPMGQGDYVIDSRDPSGRLMARAQGKGDYRVVAEGIDNDKDGRVNEDGIGGLDLHRNYPENWRPMKEETGRGQTQSGAGEFPLSEIETRAVVMFLLTHPNVSVVNSMDTSVPMLLRPPSTSKSEDRMYPDDLELYKDFDKKGKEITGYQRAGDVYYDYSNGRSTPLFGHGPDFGYWYYGAIWYGDELYDGGRFIGDYNKDGITDDLDRLQYCDKELKLPRFHAWTKAIHPDYGEVEIGGFDGKFLSQNPPPEKLEEWAEKEARFNLMLAGSLPSVEMETPKVSQHGDEYTIEVKVENQGVIPTALRQAQLVKIVIPDEISRVFPSGMIQGRGRGARGGGGAGGGGGRGDAPPAQSESAPASKVAMVEPQQPSISIDRLAGKEDKKVTFKLKLNGIAGTECTVRYSSTRGGVIEKKIFIGKK